MGNIQFLKQHYSRERESKMIFRPSLSHRKLCKIFSEAENQKLIFFDVFRRRGFNELFCLHEGFCFVFKLNSSNDWIESKIFAFKIAPTILDDYTELGPYIKDNPCLQIYETGKFLKNDNVSKHIVKIVLELRDRSNAKRDWGKSEKEKFDSVLYEEILMNYSLD